MGPDPRLHYEGSGPSFLGEGWGGGIFSLFFFGGVVMPLGQAKNSDVNTFGNKSSMQPMKGSAWTHEGSNPFFFLGRTGEESFAFFPLVPIILPICSHQLVQFPNLFPNRSQ